MVLIEESAVCIAILVRISEAIVQTHRFKLGLTVDTKMEIVRVEDVTNFVSCLI